MGVHLDVGLSRKLLGAAARAYLSDLPPMDWSALAEFAAVTASPDAVNRALSRLANEGLIEGLCTPSGWYHICPSARGLSQARAVAYRPVAVATTVDDTAPPSHPPTLVARASASWTQLQTEVQTVRTAGADTWQRSTRVLSPRLTAFRATVAETWRMFTSFP